MPIFLVGAQRSGTNMMVRGLQRSPEFEVYNENHRRAFESFRLRPDEVIASIVRSSRHRYVLFKPLTDSHRTDELLDDLPVQTHGRAIWVYRNVDDRVRSATAKFGSTNLEALRKIAAGRGMHRWEAQRVSERNLELIRAFVRPDTSALTGSALFWYVRNSLYFELELDRRDDVLPVSYDAFVTEPRSEMIAICRFIGFPWRAELTAHVRRRPPGEPRPAPIDPRVRELCLELHERLEGCRLHAPASIVARTEERIV